MESYLAMLFKSHKTHLIILLLETYPKENNSKKEKLCVQSSLKYQNLEKIQIPNNLEMVK